MRELAGGRPIPILSAYRTEAYNRRIGGARLSQHAQGRGLDLSPRSARLTNEGLLSFVYERAYMEDSLIRGIGLYPWGVHMDIRSSQRIVRWNGGRVEAEVRRA